MVMMIVDLDIVENNRNIEFFLKNISSEDSFRFFEQHSLFNYCTKTKDGKPTHLSRILEHPRTCSFEKEQGYFYKYCEEKYNNNLYDEKDYEYITLILNYIVTDNLKLDWVEAATIWKNFLQKFSCLVKKQYFSISQFLPNSTFEDIILKLENQSKLNYVNSKLYCYEAARIMLCLEAISVQLTKEENFIPTIGKYVNYYPVSRERVIVDCNQMHLSDAEIMNIVLEFDDKFNKNSSIQKVYYNLEIYCRNTLALRNLKSINISWIEEKKKIKKITDIGTTNEIVSYLTFFESMFLVLKNCVNVFPLINDLFKHRFMLIVNNPIIQQQELFPFRPTYNNIFNLYIIWEDWTSNFRCNIKENEVYMLFNDLLINYTIYELLNSYDFRTTFYSYLKCGGRTQFTIRRCNKSDIKKVFSLYLSSASDTDIFNSPNLTDISMAIDCNAVWEIEIYEKPVAVAMIFTDTKNIKYRYNNYKEMDACAIDAIFVNKAYRGMGFQKLFLSLANQLGKSKKFVFAKIDSNNYYAIRNFENFGYKKCDDFDLGENKLNYSYYLLENYDKYY